ncbi:MAG: hypothetical protein R3Y32_00085 [Bacillota bacterium]
MNIICTGNIGKTIFEKIKSSDKEYIANSLCVHVDNNDVKEEASICEKLQGFDCEDINFIVCQFGDWASQKVYEFLEKSARDSEFKTLILAADLLENNDAWLSVIEKQESICTKFSVSEMMAGNENLKTEEQGNNAVFDMMVDYMYIIDKMSRGIGIIDIGLEEIAEITKGKHVFAKSVKVCDGEFSMSAAADKIAKDEILHNHFICAEKCMIGFSTCIDECILSDISEAADIIRDEVPKHIPINFSSVLDESLAGSAEILFFMILGMKYSDAQSLKTFIKNEKTTEEDDVMLAKVLMYALECQSISISSIAEEFQIGAVRAMRLYDTMYRKGYVDWNTGKLLLYKEDCEKSGAV